MPLLTSPPAQLRGNPGGPGRRSRCCGNLPRKLRQKILSVSAPAADAVTFSLRGGITVAWGSAAKTRVKVAELAVLMRTHAHYYDISDPATAVTQQ